MTTATKRKPNLKALPPAALDVERAFAQAMEQAGIAPPDNIIGDGEFQRYRLPDERPGKKSGRYILHLDGIPAGWFCDMRQDGGGHKWCSRKISDLTKDERSEFDRRIEAAKRERERERKRVNEAAAAEAAAMLDGAAAADDSHPYLSRKRVQAYGLSVGTDDELLIPVLRADGALAGLQRVYADGNKYFLPGTAKRGHYFTLGDITGARRVIIAEGYATAASIHEATGYPVVVAFDAGNLEPVARNIRKLHPQVAIIIGGDNDATQGNPGAKYAQAAAAAVGGVAILPEDTGDWNDAHLEHGLVYVRQAFAAAAADAPRSFANHDVHVDDDGRHHRIPKNVLDIAHELDTMTGSWPRRVGDLLFSDQDGEIQWLKSVDAVYAWIGGKARLQWAGGMGADGASMISKGEFVAHLQATSQTFDGVTDLPYEPAIPDYYCAWREPDYTPDGRHLERLLRFFDNAETFQDAALIKAAFLTPAWGGLPGCRPALLITAADRGSGKSTLADMVGELYGGVIEMDLTARSESEIATRLLSPKGLKQRVMRLDNLKASIGSATLEAMITSMRISGRQLYTGEASRPNYITWLITANTPSLSRDIAERSFIIRLQRPQPRPGWREEVQAYIHEHRHHILADILQVLRAPAEGDEASDHRWQSWVDGVLRRCTIDVPAVVKQNQERRDEHDEDLEEAEAIRDAIVGAVSPEVWSANGAAFIASTTVAKAVNESLGVNWSARKVAMTIEAHVQAGRLLGVRKTRTMSCKGYDVHK